MKKYFILLSVLVNVAVVLGYYFLLPNQNDSVATLHKSEKYYNYIQPSFASYVKVTRNWLNDNRSFITQDHKAELAMNMPYEIGDPKAEKAILLVHGLRDSPFTFIDLANTLVREGFYVQVLLLPGHGSDPKHMELVTYLDWQLIVDHYTTLLQRRYSKVWLGGFSTGGNLVAINAMKNPSIAGLMLFSPGFQSTQPILEKFTSVAALFTDGIENKENNLAKYSSAPINSALAYLDSAYTVRRQLLQYQVSIPTLIVVSEHDSIIDANESLNYFHNRFTNVNSKLIWYGENNGSKFFNDDRVQTYPMQLDEFKISTASHMGVTFAPSNPYYGQNGLKILCRNSFDDEKILQCENGADVWFSAWGYTEDDKIHARLTWNPYFAELEQSIASIVRTVN